MSKRQQKAKRGKARQRGRSTGHEIRNRLNAIATCLDPAHSTWIEPTQSHGSNTTPVRCRICLRIVTTLKAIRQAHQEMNPMSQVLFAHAKSHYDIIETVDQGSIPLRSTAIDQLETALGLSPQKNAKRRSATIEQLFARAGIQRYGRVFCAQPYISDVVTASLVSLTVYAKIWALNKLTQGSEFREALSAAYDIRQVLAFVRAQYDGPSITVG